MKISTNKSKVTNEIIQEVILFFSLNFKTWVSPENSSISEGKTITFWFYETGDNLFNLNCNKPNDELYLSIPVTYIYYNPKQNITSLVVTGRFIF